MLLCVHLCVNYHSNVIYRCFLRIYYTDNISVYTISHLDVPYDEQLTVDVNGDTLTKSEPRTPSAKHVQSIFSRKSADDKQEPSSDTLQTPKANPKINQSLFRKIPEDSEAACIFVGFVGGLKNALTEFVRLKEAKLFADVTEVGVRFVSFVDFIV